MTPGRILNPKIHIIRQSELKEYPKSPRLYVSIGTQTTKGSERIQRCQAIIEIQIREETQEIHGIQKRVNENKELKEPFGSLCLIT